jgi:hypothetical protein
VDQAQRIINFGSVAAAALMMPRLAFQITSHQPNQTLPMHARMRFHLIQQLASTLKVGFVVSTLHPMQKRATFVN